MSSADRLVLARHLAGTVALAGVDLTLQNRIAVVGSGAALVALIRAVGEYRCAQQWKRLEFVLKEVKEFEADPISRNAKILLAYPERHVALYSWDDPENKELIKINDDVLHAALRIHHGTPRYYTKNEAAIRDTIDTYLNGLEGFEACMRSDLVSAEELRPFIIYWLKIIGDESVDLRVQAFRSHLWRYIDIYEFRGVQSILKKFGYDITPRGQAPSPTMALLGNSEFLKADFGGVPDQSPISPEGDRTLPHSGGILTIAFLAIAFVAALFRALEGVVNRLRTVRQRPPR